jgi:hypothetical protein
VQHSNLTNSTYKSIIDNHSSKDSLRFKDGDPLFIPKFGAKKRNLTPQQDDLRKRAASVTGTVASRHGGK